MEARGGVITADEDIGVGARFSLLPVIAATRTAQEAASITFLMPEMSRRVWGWRCAPNAIRNRTYKEWPTLARRGVEGDRRPAIPVSIPRTYLRRDKTRRMPASFQKKVCTSLSTRTD